MRFGARAVPERSHLPCASGVLASYICADPVATDRDVHAPPSLT